METLIKATILGVGTELTTGQIVNKNGSWISEKLIPYGVTTSAHIVVPDDRHLIIEALKYCEKTSDWIFITGGLGPTSDDFTRDLVSSWAQKPLQFSEKAWGHVQVRLTSRGFTVKEIQRQQCYFPEGCTILENSQGTAHGFSLKVQTPHGEKKVFVLPGPPREIEAIWNDHIQYEIQNLTQNLDRKITKAWDTLGIGESDVAQMVEPCLTELSDKNLIEIGYRVHLPYVEVKATYLQSKESDVQAVVNKINLVLNSITVLRDFEEATQLFSEKTAQTDFAFYDFVTRGFLHHRMSQQLKKFKNWHWKQSDHSMDSDFFSDETNFLALFPSINGDDRAVLLADHQGQRFSLEIEAPMKSPLMAERRQQYFAERALIEFIRRLK